MFIGLNCYLDTNSSFSHKAAALSIKVIAFRSKVTTKMPMQEANTTTIQTVSNQVDDMIPEIQSLTSQVQLLDASSSWWSNAYQTCVFLTALCTLLAFISGWKSNNKNNELKNAQNSLLRAKDAQLGLDLKNKDEKIAATNKEAQRIESAANVKIAETDRKAAEANAEAAKANEGLAKSQVEVAQLRTEAERTSQQTALVSLKVEEEARKRVEAERALLLLQERIQPRRLMEEQSAELLSILKANPKGHIDVVCMHGDAESCALAAQIVSLLRNSSLD